MNSSDDMLEVGHHYVYDYMSSLKLYKDAPNFIQDGKVFIVGAVGEINNHDHVFVVDFQCQHSTFAWKVMTSTQSLGWLVVDEGSWFMWIYHRFRELKATDVIPTTNS